MMRHAYYIVQTMVIESRPEEHHLKLQVLSGEGDISKIKIESSNLVFLQPHSPRLKNTTTVDTPGNIDVYLETDGLNFVTGFVNFPNVKDYLLVGVYLSAPTGSQGYIVQIVENKKIIIFGQIAREPFKGNKFDNIIMDRSGAKIHFNHGWLDNKNIVTEDKKVKPTLTGHLTIVGNRMVTLSGRRFLPFSAYSHILQRGITVDSNKSNPKIFFQSRYNKDHPNKLWSDVFTRDVGSAFDYEDIFDPDFTEEFNPFPDSLKYLEPPCPLPEEDMKMHDSGWKRLIHEDGSEQKFYSSKVTLVGKNFKRFSFAPDNTESYPQDIDSGFDDTERLTLHDHNTDMSDITYYYNGTDVWATRINARDFGLKEELFDGYTFYTPLNPATKPSEVKTRLDFQPAEIGKYKIIIDTKKFIIDAIGNKLTLTDGTRKIEITSSSVIMTDGTRTITMDGSTVDIT